MIKVGWAIEQDRAVLAWRKRYFLSETKAYDFARMIRGAACVYIIHRGGRWKFV